MRDLALSQAASEAAITDAYYKQSRRTRPIIWAKAGGVNDSENRTSPVTPLQFGMDESGRSVFQGPGGSDCDMDYNSNFAVLYSPCNFHLDFMHVIQSRDKLREVLNEVQSVQFSLVNVDQHLKDRSHRLFDDEDSSVTLWRNKYSTVHDLAHLALAQVVDFVKIYDAEHDLLRALAAGAKGMEVQDYVYKLELLEEAISKGASKSKSCVALSNLRHAVQILSHRSLVDKAWKARLDRVGKTLQRVQESMVSQNDDVEILELAHRHLERLWKTILMENGMNIPLNLSSLASANSVLDAKVIKPPPPPPPPPPPLPPHIVLTLRDIIEKIHTTDRLKACMDAYTDIRAAKANESLQLLSPTYLNATTPAAIDKLEWIDLEQHISLWKQHLDVFINVILTVEHEVCRQVFSSTFQSSNVTWKLLFVQICMHAGLNSFFQFADAVAKSNQIKEAHKLFNLLDMVIALQSHRHSLEELMGTESSGCRGLIQRLDDTKLWLVRAVSKAFRQFRFEVDLQVLDMFPLDGGMLHLSVDVMELLSCLMCDRYETILKEAVMLEQGGRGMAERGDSFGLVDAVVHMLKSLERRIDACGKDMEDEILCHLFLMNNYWHIYTSLAKNKQLTGLVGEKCVQEYREKAKEQAHKYQRKAWASVLQHLVMREEVGCEPNAKKNGSAGSFQVQASLELQKVRAFQVAFEGSYRKHKEWRIPDCELRDRIGNAVVRLVVPSYRAYIVNFEVLMKQSRTQVQLKYSVDMIQQMLTALFKEKLAESSYSHGSPGCQAIFNKNADVLRKLRSMKETDHFLQDGIISRSHSANNAKALHFQY